MNIEELKELYINNNENVDSETRGWVNSIFGVNTNGDSFWSIGIDYMYELIKLLGNKKVYDKFNIEQLENLFDNEKYIQELLNVTNDSEYIKLKEILSLNESVKKMLYDYIKSKLLKIKLETWRNNLKVNSQENIIYAELKPEKFSFEDGIYVAENVLFKGLEVDKIEILDNLEDGLNTINSINQQYKDIDLKNMCIELLVNGDYSDWEEDATSYDKCIKLLTGKIQYISIYNGKMAIWFNTTSSHSFGGHNPVLTLYANKEYKFVGIE